MIWDANFMDGMFIIYLMIWGLGCYFAAEDNKHLARLCFGTLIFLFLVHAYYFMAGGQ